MRYRGSSLLFSRLVNSVLTLVLGLILIIISFCSSLVYESSVLGFKHSQSKNGLSDPKFVKALFLAIPSSSISRMSFAPSREESLVDSNLTIYFIALILFVLLICVHVTVFVFFVITLTFCM